MRFTYLVRNLTRNPVRTVLTSMAVALPIMIYVLSTATIDGIDRFLTNSVKQLRLVVVHKASIVNPLPAGYRAKIEALDPSRTKILSVCGIQFIGGRVERVKTPLSTLAVDVDTFAATFPEYQLTEEELGLWQRDRQAIIVGSGIALKFGWKVGDRITIRPSISRFPPMEFHVIAMSLRSTDPITNYCRRDYLEAELDRTRIPGDLVTFFFVKCATMDELNDFRVAIDESFSKSIDETKTQDEKTFINEFVTQQFNLPARLTILGAVTVFVAIMAATNTMSMNFRDRLGELATLKALGFRGMLVFGLIQAESMFLCMIGGIIGAGGPYVAFTHTPLRNYTVPLIQYLEVRPAVCLHALGFSVLIGFAAALWPAWRALRLNVVTALRALD